MKKIRLTESELRRIVKETVRKVINRKDTSKLSNDDLDTEDTPFGSFKVKNWHSTEPSKLNNDTKLSRIVKEATNKVLKEGGLRINYGVDNDSLEKKWHTYENLIYKIRWAAKDLKRITGNQSPDVPHYNKKDERLWNFSNALEELLAEYGLETGFDSTEDMTW